MRITPQAASWAPPKPNEHPLGLDPSRLRLFASGDRPLSFPTDGSIFKLGRDEDSLVRLSGARSSRHHADGCYKDGQLYLLDRSSQGTWINGQRVLPQAWVAVPNGARLDLGGELLTLGVGGTNTIMTRLDDLKPTADRHQFRFGDGTVMDIPEAGKPLRLGRQPGADVSIRDSSVSRYHADVLYQFGQLHVRDVGSTYGTYVDGKRLPANEWVTVPEGRQLQFGQGKFAQLSLEPKPPMVITYFGDSSTPDIAAGVAAQGGGFQRALETSGAPAIVRGLVAKGSFLKDAGLAAVPAMGVAQGVAGLGMAAYGIATALAVGSLASLPFAAVGLSLTAAGFYTAKVSKHLWRGGLASLKQRLQNMPVKPSQWSKVQQTEVAGGPSMSKFKSLYTENMQRYPTSEHLVFLSGHGDGSSAAGLKFSKVAQVVKGADAIFLDSCNGAQLEALATLSGSTRVVVASEHPVNGGGFPVHRMFARGSFPENPRDLGAVLVQSASREMPAESLVAVDTKALKEELLPALDQLGQYLSAACDKGWKGRIKAEMKEVQAPARGILGFGRKLDLGSFLGQIADIKELHCPQLVAAQAALNKTILAMSGNGTISFQAGGSKSLPKGFNDFLKRL